ASFVSFPPCLRPPPPSPIHIIYSILAQPAAQMDQACPAIVCEECGSGAYQELLVNCTQCNGYRHRYCLVVVEFEMIHEWCCGECQKKDNGDTKPIEGENSEVKPIPSQEVALLSMPTTDNWPRFVVRHKRTPRKMKCVSPNRSENQAFALKRCAIASQNQIKVEDMNKRQKVLSGATMFTYNRNGKVKNNDHQLRDQPKEAKVAGAADKRKFNSWVGDQPTGKMAFSASVPTDANIGRGSGTKSLNNNIDMPVIISSSAEYARRPPPEAVCWTGCFLLSDGEIFNLGEFKAYHPSVVSPRVCNIAKKMPTNMQLKISPRKNYWPKTFEKISPVYEDIALLFFSAEVDCWNKKHPCLVDTRCGFVMHAYIDDMMLLMYSSEVLPPDCQWIDGKSYLWGVFVKPKSKSNHARLGSVAT
uniref:AIPP2-like SPOC-like domain-containing protein n=3 Tax=Triticinae TaxID=1648030 RepID=A0A453MBE2_AEGTS